jgi:uncharacterized protein affecting Mg2+/Co2+ transport
VSPILVISMLFTEASHMCRHWEFRNRAGVVSTIPKWGPGVIGLKPVINPGDAFVYISFAQIFDSYGWMEGALLIENVDTKEVMDVPVAKCDFVWTPKKS